MKILEVDVKKNALHSIITKNVLFIIIFAKSVFQKFV